MSDRCDMYVSRCLNVVYSNNNINNHKANFVRACAHVRVCGCRGRGKDGVRYVYLMHCSIRLCVAAMFHVAISVSVPQSCHRNSTSKTWVILPKVPVAGYS